MFTKKRFTFYLRVLFLITVVFSFSLESFAKETALKRIQFQRAFAVAIDDMGWNNGGSLGNTGGPWRVGFRRNFDVRDYRPIVEIGKAVGVRFQGLFILCEMDRLNVCAKYPTTTKAGPNFDNSDNIDPLQFEAMNYVKDNAAYLEFGLHGVGHEHWIDGKRTRAEWYDLENNKPWPEQDSRDHIKCFKEIMAQYGWTKENGQSFPESFVPCAYGYYWNPNGDWSTGKLMFENGVKYVNTLFTEISELTPPVEPNGGGFDHGVLVINRINYGNEWFEPASLPKKSLEKYESDIIETHFANWLATDDFLQPELNQKWIKYFKVVQADPEHYLAKNTEQFFSQWLYKKFTIVTEEKIGIVIIDNSKMPDEAYKNELLGNMVLAVPLQTGQHVSKAELNKEPISAYFEDADYGFIYLPPLDQKQYRLKYSVGSNLMENFVNNTGTYNVYNVEINKDRVEFDLKMYGTQSVKIKCNKPTSISSSNPNLRILSYQYNSKDEVLSIRVHGRDMQGETGRIVIKF